MPRWKPLTLLVGGAVMALPAGIASAHEPVAPSVQHVVSAWSFEPGVILALVVLAWLYDLGVRSLWQHHGRGRVIGTRQLGAFTGAIITLVVALISPVDALADSLFSAHMAQHMLLVLVVPPLLIAARTDLAVIAAFPPTWQRRGRGLLRHGAGHRLVQALLHPATAWWLFAAVFWAWHAPVLYEAALHHDSVHALEHAALLLVGLAFWRVVLREAGRRPFAYPLAILFVFTAMLQMSVLAALLTFSPYAWYPDYGASTALWGLSTLTDQRIGALVMWMTSNAVFLGLIAMLFARWFAAEERRASHYAPNTP